MKLLLSNILTAYRAETVGSKVTDSEAFEAALTDAVGQTDFGAQRVPGQAVVPLGGDPSSYVSPGTGKSDSTDVDDYVLRVHRGRVKKFLRREAADSVAESCAAVVYTREAYLLDPDVQSDPEEFLRTEESDATHVLVAVLATAKGGPKVSPMSPGTFVRNLAGANNEALDWTADEIRAKAGEISEYYQESGWSVVAD